MTKAHTRAILAHLRDLGVNNVDVRQNRHVQMTWRAGEREMRITISPSPHDIHSAIVFAKQQIARQFRQDIHGGSAQR